MAAAALHLPKNGGRDWTVKPLVEAVKDAGEREVSKVGEEEEERLSIWKSILQQDKGKREAAPYVHPLMRGSSGGLMSQRSMEICTESLGSETGSDGFSSADELHHSLLLPSKRDSDYIDDEMEEEEREDQEMSDMEIPQRKELTTVNYHCSIGRRSPPRPFPPPLPSISRRDGPCIQMRHHRCNGRLIVEAIPVPSHNYLHAERRAGRLVLSLIDTFSKSLAHNPVQDESEEKEGKRTLQEAEEAELVVAGDDEEEEEVQVVDRGTVVEVKVSAKPQPVGSATSVKVHRSSLVINKFVVGPPQAAAAETQPLNYDTHQPEMAATAAAKRPSPTATMAAALRAQTTAADAEAKLLFASKRRSRKELLHDMRWCSELRRPLFIFEQPCCIATSS